MARVALLLVGLSLALAEGPPTLSEAEVTRLIASARSEVLVEMSVFDDRAVAEGYRVAVVERGARGYILSRRETAELLASYLPWASILPRTGARLVAYTRGDYAVVDRRVAIVREERNGLPVYRVVAEPGTIARMVQEFVQAYATALPYSVEGMVRRAVERTLR